MTTKILGIGRCIIGNIKKEIEETGITQVTLEHHYVLNLKPALNSKNVSFDYLNKLDFECGVRPSLKEQISWLRKIHDFQHVVIEIFPPAPLLFNKELELYCSVESVNNTLLENNFKEICGSLSQTNDIEDYIRTLLSCIEKINNINPSIKIILINGEYYHKSEELIVGNILLKTIIDALNQNLTLIHKNVSLINMTDLLDQLSVQQKAFVDTEYTYHYIRHNPDLEIINIARDCKHASYNLRTHLLNSFLTNISSNKELGNLIPSPFSLSNLRLDINPKDRAQSYLNQNFDYSIEKMDSRELSKILEYSQQVDKLNEQRIKDYIMLFFSSEISENRLKTDLYKIRSLSAYILKTKSSEYIPLLLKLLDSLLCLPDKIIKDQIEFVLLWIKNISLVLSIFLKNNEEGKYLSSVYLLIKNLSNQQILIEFPIVNLIIKKIKASIPV